MRNLALCAVFLSASVALAQSDGGVVKYINPFIGTGAVDANSLMGNTFPGATVPFGMVQLSPDVKDKPSGDDPSGYDYSQKRIYGFSHTHLSGTGCVDLLDFLVMPTSRDLQSLARTNDYSSTFSHDNEKASAGYYQVRPKRPRPATIR